MNRKSLLFCVLVLILGISLLAGCGGGGGGGNKDPLNPTGPTDPTDPTGPGGGGGNPPPQIASVPIISA